MQTSAPSFRAVCCSPIPGVRAEWSIEYSIVVCNNSEEFSGQLCCRHFNYAEEELVMRDYMGNCAFFDVIGDIVYNVIETSGTADIAYVAELEGKRVIVKTDLTHGGR